MIIREDTLVGLRRIRGKEVKVIAYSNQVVEGTLVRVGKKNIKIFRYAFDTPVIDYPDIISIKESV